MHKQSHNMTILWMPGDEIEFERYLRTCVRVASPDKTIYVCIDKHGNVRAIASTRLTRKPDSQAWTLVRGNTWIDTNGVHKRRVA